MTEAQKTIAGLSAKLEETERERAELAVVVDSVREIVRCGWVHRQEPCPFCRSVFKHKPFCYLNSHAGALIIAEYADIERQRDYLLARLREMMGTSPTLTKRSLKARMQGRKKD